MVIICEKYLGENYMTRKNDAYLPLLAFALSGLVLLWAVSDSIPRPISEGDVIHDNVVASVQLDGAFSDTVTHEPRQTDDELQVVYRPHGYILGELNGFVALYLERASPGLDIVEVTNIPLAALPPDEQQRLLEGIRIDGEEELARFLQDFGS